MPPDIPTPRPQQTAPEPEPFRPWHADELAAALERLLADATEIEGWPCEVDRVTSRKIRIRFSGNRRFEITVVKKR